MYDLYTVEVFIRERQQSILDEVTRNRMAKRIRPSGPGIGERFSTKIGDVFISLGNRLKRRYAAGQEENAMSACDGKACVCQ